MARGAASHYSDRGGGHTSSTWRLSAREHERPGVGSVLVAAVLTGIGACVMTVSFRSLVALDDADDLRVPIGAIHEVVVYATIPPRDTSSSPARVTRVARVAPIRNQAIATSTSPLAAPETARVATSTDSRGRAPAGIVSPVRAVRPLMSRSTTLDAVGRDSVWAEVRSSIPIWAIRRRRGQPEVDSLLRLETFRQEAWRGRPMPVSGIYGSLKYETVNMSGGGMSLPLFARGPSRAQRARDSVIHADNLERLARLAARARAKVDSTGQVRAARR